MGNNHKKFLEESKTYEIKMLGGENIIILSTSKNIIGLWIWSIKENKQTVISIDEANIHILNTEIAYIKEV